MVRLAPLILIITGLFNGLSFAINHGFAIFLKNPIFGLLVGDALKNIVVMIPCFLIENDLFTVNHLFSVQKKISPWSLTWVPLRKPPMQRKRDCLDIQLTHHAIHKIIIITKLMFPKSIIFNIINKLKRIDII